MAVLDHARTDRVLAEADGLDVARLLLTLVVGVFYALGWLAGRTARGVMVLAAGVKLGFLDAYRSGRDGSRRGPA